jgi:UDP-GlcNAc:undecaprenyl-phosphate GlcNAc-1-phosphate transferase
MFLSLTFFLVFCAAAATLTATLIPVLSRMAVRRGLVDRPQGRKDHGRPVPPIGGLVIVPLLMILLPIVGVMPQDHAALYIALTIVLVLGWLDDRRDLPAALKLGAQIVIALILTISGEARLDHLGYLFGPSQWADLSWLAIPFSAVCFIFFMNAMNMMDGMDGLAGGAAFIMAFWLAVAAVMGADYTWAAAALLLMSLLFGFLTHNMRYPGHRRATVFLGDSGSLSLGVIIGWLGMNVTMAETPGIPPIVMAFIIMVPIFDTFALFIARVRAGRGAFSPGRDHLHHVLLGKMDANGTYLVLMALILFSGGLGLVGSVLGVPQIWLTISWCCMLGLYSIFRVVVYKTDYLIISKTSSNKKESRVF